MGRLISFPPGLGITGVTILSGPSARGSGANTMQDGSEQTFSGVGDLWAFRIEMVVKKDRGARRERGIMRALGNGANAMRFEFIDPDTLSASEAGIVGPHLDQPWSNGLPWDNGENWHPTYPNVSVSAASAAGSSIINLEADFWGHALGLGDYIGFFPFHFGMYEITEVLHEGQYRVWPRLRKAITVDDFATLHPVLAVKTTPGGTVQGRGLVTTEGQSMTLVEIPDPYVRQYFTG